MTDRCTTQPLSDLMPNPLGELSVVTFGSSTITLTATTLPTYATYNAVAVSVTYAGYKGLGQHIRCFMQGAPPWVASKKEGKKKQKPEGPEAYTNLPDDPTQPTREDLGESVYPAPAHEPHYDYSNRSGKRARIQLDDTIELKN